MIGLQCTLKGGSNLPIFARTLRAAGTLRSAFLANRAGCKVRACDNSPLNVRSNDNSRPFLAEVGLASKAPRESALLNSDNPR